MQKFKLGVPIRDMRLLDPHLATSETGRVLVCPLACLSRCTEVLMLPPPGALASAVIAEDGTQLQALQASRGVPCTVSPTGRASAALSMPGAALEPVGDGRTPSAGRALIC